MPIADIYQNRSFTIRLSFVLVALLLIGWLLRMQVFDDSLQERAKTAGMSRITEYPARGLFLTAKIDCWLSIRLSTILLLSLIHI
jgi:hypothetical protein